MAQATTQPTQETELAILHLRIISNDERERTSVTMAGLRNALELASRPESKALVLEGFHGNKFLRLTIDVEAKRITVSLPIDELLEKEDPHQSQQPVGDLDEAIDLARVNRLRAEVNTHD